MKTGRFLVLLALVMGLLAGPWQAPAEAEMLGRPSQIINLSYSYDPEPHWAQTKPDGSISVFTLAAGQSFIMTEYSGSVLCHRPWPPKPARIAFTFWVPTPADVHHQC